MYKGLAYTPPPRFVAQRCGRRCGQRPCCVWCTSAFGFSPGGRVTPGLRSVLTSALFLQPLGLRLHKSARSKSANKR
jgi:hypothetical protein